MLERDTGLVVGSIGLFWPPSAGVLEIGYGIVPSRRGRRGALPAPGSLVRAVRAVSGQWRGAGPESGSP
ncbi:hypothetical protein [Nocardia sp. X0981]